MKLSKISSILAVIVLLGFSQDLFATVPTSHIKGIDELFLPAYKIYSPLTGMLLSEAYIKRNLEIEKSESLQKLTSFLFSKVPGAELKTSHLMSSPGSHFTPAVIGRFFVIYENLRTENLSAVDAKLQLRQQFKAAMLSDLTYQSSIGLAATNLRIARAEYDEFLQRDETAKLQGNVKNASKSRDRKRAREEWEYQQSLNDISGDSYNRKVDELMEVLAECFFRYEIRAQKSDPYCRATTGTLISYLWMKHTEKSDLADYMNAMGDAGFLSSDFKTLNNPDFYRDTFSESDYDAIRQGIPKHFPSKWLDNHFAEAMAFTLDGGGKFEFPPVMNFIHVLWARYSRFGDCGEIAIHNILNWMAFNPKTHELDYRILEALRDRYYPQMSEQLIAFYKKFPTLAEQDTTKARGEWMAIASNLNEGLLNLPKNQKIQYGRGKNQTELLPPVSNLFRAIYRLLGYADVNVDHMNEIFDRVKDTSGFSVTYKREGQSIALDNEALFMIGKNRFVLTTVEQRHAIVTPYLDRSEKLTQDLIKLVCKKSKGKFKTEIDRFRYSAARVALSCNE